MKTAIFSLGLAAIAILASCTGTNKTGGATRDSSASHGYSGATNANASSAGSAVGATPMGTDTSKTGKSTAEPTVDTAKKKP